MPYAHTGDTGVSPNSRPGLHLGNGRNRTYSGNLLRKAESGTHGRLIPRSRGAAGRRIPPHLVRAPAAFRAADPAAGQQGSQGASSLGQKRGAGLRRGHRDPGPQARRLQVRGSGGTLACTCSRRRGSGFGHAECADPRRGQVITGRLWGERGNRRRERLSLRVSQERR